MGRGEPGCEGKEPGSGMLSLGHLLAPQRCQEGLCMYFECGKYFRTSIKKYDFQEFRWGTSLGSPVVKTSPSSTMGEGSIHSQKTRT